ncbi:MAG: hypothetical protein R2806_23990 [Saprospiraceae bacterium]
MDHLVSAHSGHSGPLSPVILRDFFDPVIHFQDTLFPGWPAEDNFIRYDESALSGQGYAY